MLARFMVDSVGDTLGTPIRYMGDSWSGRLATHHGVTGCAVWSTKSIRCRRVGGFVELRVAEPLGMQRCLWASTGTGPPTQQLRIAKPEASVLELAGADLMRPR